MPQVTIDQALQMALQQHQGGRLAEAETIYRQILGVNPNHPVALHLLGVLAGQTGQLDAGIMLIRRAIEIEPRDPAFHENLGKLLVDKRQYDEAIASCRRAIELNGGAGAYCNLGYALEGKGAWEEAIAANREALRLQPDLAMAHANLGILMRRTGAVDEAIREYGEALRLRPDWPEVHNDLGIALQARGKTHEAVGEFRRTLQLQPDHIGAWINLGNTLKDIGGMDEAMAAWQEALRISPGRAEALCNLGNAYKDTGRLVDAIEAYRAALRSQPGLLAAHDNLVYTLHFLPEADGRMLKEELGIWSKRFAEPLKKLIVPHENDRAPERRLRVGYVSPDFREHVVGRFLWPLLAASNHEDFELFCYSDVLVPDARTEQFKGYADRWRSIVGMSDERVAQWVREDQIDVLVDLTMHMTRSRLLVFARKPAPVQVTYLAYCSTTGLEAMDYRLSDPYLDPPESDSSGYSEETVRLPESYWCYEQSEATPDVNEPPALNAGYVTFGCLNNFCKVSGRALAAWGKLLGRVANSRLIIHSVEGSHRARVWKVFEAMGVERGRVEFVGFAHGEAYFRNYQRMDVVLDPFPYAGGTTTCDALWMGVPVVTLAGKLAVGRGGVSILTNVGVPELVAQSEEEYVGIAARLAGDMGRLVEFRRTLRGKMQGSALMDAPRFARNVEAAYRGMWRRWCGVSR